MDKPLDLRALEAQLDNTRDTEAITLTWGQVKVLIAALRETRAAMVEAKGYAGEIERSLFDREGDAKTMAQHIQRQVAAVLASVTDGPEAG